MDRILVGIKLCDSLEEDITISFKGTFINQILDYEGIPFKCGCCHSYGHIARDCTKEDKRHYWVKIFAGGLEANKKCP